MLNFLKLSSLGLLSILFVSCSNNDPLRSDAHLFCEAYGVGTFEGVWSSISMDEAEMLVIQNQMDKVQTEEFRSIIEDLTKVKHYREVYSHAKALIEEVTGESWNCQEMEKFYSLRTKRESSSDLNTLTSLELTISAEGEILFEDSKVDLSQIDSPPDTLKKALSNTEGAEVIVRMEAGANDEYLSSVLGFLARHGVGNVKVFSDEGSD